MEVILIRHAEAGERDNARWPDDDLRPITGEGAARQRQVAKAMRTMGIGFDFLATSPRLRAKQTADVVAEAYKWEEAPLLAEPLGAGYSPAALLKFLAKFPPGSTVALVGHEPDLSQFAAHCVSPDGRASMTLKKSGVIGISFEGPADAGRGRLAYLLKPGQMKRLS